MSTSGNKEIGVRPASWLSSDFGAGIPIKKRRFPFIRPPSPSAEELSREESCSAQSSLILNASNVATSDSCLHAANKINAEVEDKKPSNVTNLNLVQNKVNHTRVKNEEQSLPIQSASLALAEQKDNFDEANKIPSLLGDSAKLELKIAPSDTTEFKLTKEIDERQSMEGDLATAHVNAELSTANGNTELLSSANRNTDLLSTANANTELLSDFSGIADLTLGVKEHLATAVAGPKSERSCQDHIIEEPISLNLSLRKLGCSTYDNTNKLQGSCIPTNKYIKRSNWNLNTSMDTWDGSDQSDNVSQVSVACLNTIGSTHDMPPAIAFDLPSIVVSEKTDKELVEQKAGNGTSLPECSLSLGLGPLCPSGESSSLSSGIDLAEVAQNISLSRQIVPSCNVNMVNLRPVKSELLDVNIRQNQSGVLLGSSNAGMKCELIESQNQESNMPSKIPTTKSVDSAFIKPEPAYEVPLEAIQENKTMGKQILQAKDGGKVTTYTTVVSVGLDVTNCTKESVPVNLSQGSALVHKEACQGGKPVAELISSSINHEDKKCNGSGEVVTSPIVDTRPKGPELCRFKVKEEILPDSGGTGEVCLSDEEKINVSSSDLLEEFSYGSDSDSNGDRTRNLSDVVNKKQAREDEYEDGEVRESANKTAAEDDNKVECPNNSNLNITIADVAGRISDDLATSSHVEEKIAEPSNPGVNNNDDAEESVDPTHQNYTKNDVNKDASLQVSVEIPIGEVEKKRHLQASQRNQLGELGGIGIPKCLQGDLFYDQRDSTTCRSLKSSDLAEQIKATASGDDQLKEASSGGSQNRIINLTRALNTSPGGARSISSKLLPLRSGGERSPDAAPEAEKIYHRGRDETCNDGSFPRESRCDQSSRDSRLSFMRERGRISSRRDSDGNFAGEFFHGRREFSLPEHKYESGIRNVDMEMITYDDVAEDGTFVRNGRRGRNISSDEDPFFSHLTQRRRFTGGRFGHGRGLPLMHRGLRNCSPGRCAGEDDSGLLEFRNREKFTRNLPDDNADPMFTRAHPQYEGLDGRFVRRNMNFLTGQRRGLPFRSRSPNRLRTCSDGPWSSLRMRSPEGFVRRSELPRQRSPPGYRIERMRSPTHPCFGGDVRRHGSPPYMSGPSNNNMRDMDSGPRFRNMPSRVVVRNHEKFDVMDPRVRTETDDYFEGPNHSEHFEEFGVDGNVEERRRFGDRSQPVRSFRQYNGSNGDNFSSENGPKPFRFCKENDSEIHERGIREFDRRIRNQPGDAPRRTRNLEEKEGNSRHGGQVWHDDVQRLKRKRF